MLFAIVGCQLWPNQSVESEHFDTWNAPLVNLESELIESKSSSEVDSVESNSRMVIYSADMTVAVEDPIGSMGFVSRLQYCNLY